MRSFAFNKSQMGPRSPQRRFCTFMEKRNGEEHAIHIAYDLALQELDMNRESARIAWVTGKYDEQREGARPFSAILDAVTELYGMLEDSTISAIRQAFNDEELTDLSAVIALPLSLQVTPSVEDGNFTAPAESADDMSAHKNDSNQFKTFLRLFRRLLALICSHYNCVVLMLDDVQWMDDVSKDLSLRFLEKISSPTFSSSPPSALERKNLISISQKQTSRSQHWRLHLFGTHK